MPDPTVSVVIPYFNSGQYILEAVDSVETYPDASAFEIIIVDDGSTDPESLRTLDRLHAERGYQIIHQPNLGPAAARNAGIRAARGRYLLLLDSDNKIRPRYISEGIAILDSDATVGVVHGNAAFFGMPGQPRFKSRPFDLKDIVVRNYIDNCTVIRKSVWKDVGEFDEARILIGNEDWEFWLRVGARGWKFRYVDETLFDYRLRPDSLVATSTSTRFEAMHRYVMSKHLHIVMGQYLQLLAFRQNPPRYLIGRLYRRARQKWSSLVFARNAKVTR